MSFRFMAELLCDGCEEKIVARPEHRVTEANSVFWTLRRSSEKQGWITLHRPYRPNENYCGKCADKPRVVVKKMDG